MLINTLLKKKGAPFNILRSNFLIQQSRHFARFKPPGLGVPEEFLKQEAEAFEEKKSKRERDLMRAHRLALVEVNKEEHVKDKLWWNRIQKLTESDLELMPLGFTIKYGTFGQKVLENQLVTDVAESRAFEGRYEKVNTIDRLKTYAELELVE